MPKCHLSTFHWVLLDKVCHSIWPSYALKGHLSAKFKVYKTPSSHRQNKDQYNTSLLRAVPLCLVYRKCSINGLFRHACIPGGAHEHCCGLWKQEGTTPTHLQVNTLALLGDSENGIQKAITAPHSPLTLRREVGPDNNCSQIQPGVCSVGLVFLFPFYISFC